MSTRTRTSISNTGESNQTSRSRRNPVGEREQTRTTNQNHKKLDRKSSCSREGAGNHHGGQGNRQGIERTEMEKKETEG